MIPPRLQWCHQIVITSVCWPEDELTGELSACSNCTRLLGHEKKRFVMTPEQFRDCVLIARDFLYRSPPCPQGRKNKVLGIFGGEPLLSPYFNQYVNLLVTLVPEPEHRGLWTSVDWETFVGPRYGPAKPWVEKLLNDEHGVRRGYLNWNMHTKEQKCEHHPVLLSISDLIPSEKEKMSLIENCWLNRDWSAAYSLDHNNEPKFYFCEVASSFDRIMKLNCGLPLVSDVWNHDLFFVTNDSGVRVPAGIYGKQIMSTCTRCGQPLPLRQGRRDLENMDDISPSNLSMLTDSPMVRRGDYHLADPKQYERPRIAHNPAQYIKDGYHKGNHVNDR